MNFFFIKSSSVNNRPQKFKESKSFKVYITENNSGNYRQLFKFTKKS